MLIHRIFLTYCFFLVKERIYWTPTLLFGLQPHLYQLDFLLIRLRVKFHKLIIAVHIPSYPIFFNMYWPKATQSFLKHYKTLSLWILIFHFQCTFEVRLTRNKRQLLWFRILNILEICGLMMLLLVTKNLFFFTFFDLHRRSCVHRCICLVAYFF